MLHAFRSALHELLPSRYRKISATVFRICAPPQQHHDGGEAKHNGPVAVNKDPFGGPEAVLARLSRSTQLRRDSQIHLIALCGRLRLRMQGSAAKARHR
jgi:hypothetical protein